ncbi:DUF2079 domain-containing protein [Patescibacteria group bacterium]|nr:DUF2079 domain-containing protein [Patescibacteria group bacterium]
MKKLKGFVQKYIYLIILFFFAVLIFGVNYRINVFRYNNFDYGKFDLGNMSQMVWNTLNGRFMYLTDYFGTNLPRWAMSHVDPILLMFVPAFLVWPSPLSLVFSQLILVIFSAFIIYKIAKLELDNKFCALLWGVIFLAYPAVGFITAWTGFHGVSVVIPFFLYAFYIFERDYRNGSFKPRSKLLFWILLILTMCGKEQVPLYIFMYGIFILLFRTSGWVNINHKFLSTKWLVSALKLSNVMTALSMLIVSMLWFYWAFFIIIPKYAPYRVAGYDKFAESLGIENAQTRDVALPNYFLSRYDAFGESYVEILVNMITHPKKLIKVFFGGDRVDNLRRTFEPLGYLPLLNPQLLMLAFPDFLINYGTSAGGIGTAEISNHRISMIIPILFISSIYSVTLVTRTIQKVFGGAESCRKLISAGISATVLFVTFYATYKYNNPVYLWLTQAVKKRLAVVDVYASDEMILRKETDLSVGDVFKLSKLENKDRDCAQKIVDMIPDGVSVSGPDYLGAQLSLRETYAIYPALYNTAEYVIVDVFSRKLLTILDVNLDLSKEVVQKLLSSEEYILEAGCGNLFVFKRVDHVDKSELLPLQEKYKYAGSVEYELFQGLYVVDYKIPSDIERGVTNKMEFVYEKRGSKSIEDYVMFVTYVNSETKDSYQAANLPSFAIKELGEWKQDRFYLENVDIALPEYLEPGIYWVFIGMSNNVRTRSMYIGDTEVL